GRLPYLDHHLFEFVRTLPISMLIADGIEKHVLREAVRPLLTETVLARRKHPLIAPPIQAFGGGHPLIDETLRGRALAELGLFDQRRVIALLDRTPSMTPAERVATEPVLMTVLTAALLQEKFRLSEIA